MIVANDTIVKVRDDKTRKIVSDLQLDVGVNIFYRFTKKDSIGLHPSKYHPTPRYNPSFEVGRSRRTSEKIGRRIIESGNWIKMEERGYLEPEIEKVGLNLERVIYARDWDDFSDGGYTTYSGGEITEITSGGRGGLIHRSPIRESGFGMATELDCGFDFYSITNNNKLQRDTFTASVGVNDEPLRLHHISYVTDIEHQRVIRGSSNGLVRVTSKAVDRLLRKDHFDREVWELYERCLRGK